MPRTQEIKDLYQSLPLNLVVCSILKAQQILLTDQDESSVALNAAFLIHTFYHE